MKCKICYQNDTNNTSGICYLCIFPTVSGTGLEELLYESEMDLIMKQVFKPYNNLVDWAMNRHT